MKKITKWFLAATFNEILAATILSVIALVVAVVVAVKLIFEFPIYGVAATIMLVFIIGLWALKTVVDSFARMDK